MAAMTANPTGGFRLTVLGCSSAPPHEAWPAAGYLVEWDSTAVLLDVGQGVVRRLAAPDGPDATSSAVVDRPHACRPLPRPRRPALPVPVGRGRAGRAAGPPAARCAGPPRRPGDRRLGASRLLRRRLRRPASTTPRSPLRIGPLTHPFRPRAATTSRRGASSSRRPTASRLGYTGDTGPSDERGRRHARRGPPAHRGRRCACRATTTPNAATSPPRRRSTWRSRSEARSTLLVHYAPGRRAELQAAVRRRRAVDPPGGRRPDDHHRRRRHRRARRPRSGDLSRRGRPRARPPPATGSRRRRRSADSPAAVRQNAAASAAAPTASAAVGGRLEQRDRPRRVARGRAMDGDQAHEHRVPAASSRSASRAWRRRRRLVSRPA